MQQQAGVIRLLGPKLGQSEIVAENFHVLDAGSASALNFDFKVVTVFPNFDDEIARRVVKRFGVRIEQ